MKKCLVSLVLVLVLWPAIARGVTVGNECGSHPVVIGIDGTGNYDLTQATNAGWVRITIRWRDVNPASGTWTFAGYTGQVDEARSRGLNVLAILSTAPAWAGGGNRGTIPPTNIALWEEFVRRTAQQFNGKIAAYEVWNEPNLTGSSEDGVGWDRDINTYPLYVDYLRAAAKQIRTHAPTALVVGPVTSSEPNGRTTTIFRQIQQAVYPDGPGSSFVDVISFHANAGHTDSVDQIAFRIKDQLNVLYTQNPSNSNKPKWITEFGWKSNSVGLTEQKNRIKGLLYEMAGSSESMLGCGPFMSSEITHAFIYNVIDHSTSSRGVYKMDRTPKPVTTQYLRTLPYPARENDVRVIDANCVGRTCTFSIQGGCFLNYVWDFGDGTGTASGCMFTHTYSKAGRYFVQNIPAGCGGFCAGDIALVAVN